MKAILNNLKKIVFSRTTMFFVSLSIQLIIFYALIKWFYLYITYYYVISIILSLFVILAIINNKQNTAFKIAWIVPVLAIPVFGTLLYIMFNLQVIPKLMAKEVKENEKKLSEFLSQDEEIINEINEPNFIKYMNKYGNAYLYKNTTVEYFSLGEQKFEKLKEEMKKAQKFIFLEYFIIAKGKMWDEILEILKDKVNEGIEVRVMYDGMCEISLLSFEYLQELKQYGINVKMFNPIKPIISTHQNNRDHRKIVIIDGHTAFTGGINISDEYINETSRFGHWKDNAVMIKGEAVKSFTAMFLSLNEHKVNKTIYAKYILNYKYDSDGYVMPYQDNPLDHETIGKQVYLDILNNAKKYVHIMTPYLVLDDELTQAIKYASKRGVDIKIIMPHIPDKKTIFYLGRCHYKELIEVGVKMFEYKPGFVHAKTFISDDEKATVGTINLDFRSLYLNFECGLYMYKSDIINDIEKDYQSTLLKCHKVTLTDIKKWNKFEMMIGKIMKIIAPLT